MKLDFSKAVKSIEKEENEPANLSGHRILVVDDEPTNLQVMENLLGKQYPIICCESAAEALALIDAGGDAGEFSVVISDYRMPEMNGVEFFHALKKRQHPAPRIMLTGFAAMDNVVAAINQGGIFQYVTKPIDAQVVCHAVAEAVGLRQMRDENARLLSVVKDLLETSSSLHKNLAQAGGGVEEASNQGPTHKFADGKPHKMDLSVLFVDVRGFTSFTNEVPAEDLIAILQQLFVPVHRIVYESGGMIDKHLGDGLMAVFGLGGTEGAIAAAVTATQHIVEATAEVLGSLDPPFNHLRLSLGLAAGELVLGMLGTERRSELAVIGAPANLAARLQEFTKVAIGNEEGERVLGKFNRVMAALDASVLHGSHSATMCALPEGLRVRDFQYIDEIGIFRA